MTVCEQTPEVVNESVRGRVESVEPEEFLELAVSRAPFERVAATARGLVALVNSDSGVRVVVQSEKLDRHRVT